MERRAALDAGVGVLRCWGGGSVAQTREDLVEHYGHDGQDAEVARVVGIVNAEADRRADPDWD